MSSGIVLFAEHGAGVWEPVELFPDLGTMTACLAQLGSVVADAGKDFTDDDCLIRPQYRTDAMTRLTALLDTPACAEHVLATLGW
jgi:hypothetical protein